MPKHRRLLQGVAAVYALGVLAIVGAADTGTLAWIHGALHAIPLGDKLGHFGLMGVLAFVFDLALDTRTWNITERVSVRVGSTVVLVLVILEEISQIWLPARNFDWGDLTADALGIACGGVLARSLVHRCLRVSH